MKRLRSEVLLKQYITQYDLNQALAGVLMSDLELYDYEKYEALTRAGDEVVAIYLLVQGTVKIFNSLENGKTYIIRTEQAPAIYGDLELFHYATYVANTVCLTHCRAIRIPISVAKRSLTQNIVFVQLMCQSLAGRLESISTLSLNNLYLPVKAKLANYLLINQKNNCLVIDNSLTDIAQRIGTSYRHLQRILKQLNDAGVIQKSRYEIRIIDSKRLIQVAEQDQ